MRTNLKKICSYLMACLFLWAIVTLVLLIIGRLDFSECVVYGGICTISGAGGELLGPYINRLLGRKKQSAPEQKR